MMPGTRLAQIRRTLGLSPEGLARALNGASATVYKWERGTCPIPRSVELLLLLWLEHPRLKPKASQRGKRDIFP